MRRSESGYALVFVVWMLALLTLAVSYFTLWMGELVRSATDRAAQVDGIRDAMSTESLLYYLLATHLPTTAGLEFGPAREYTLRYDDTFYAGFGRTIFALQDESGLLSVGSLRESNIHFLERYGLDEDQQKELVHRLYDYIDPDDDHRIHGAEKAHYVAQGLQPPPNRNLLTGWELQRVLGWRDIPAFWEPVPIARFISVRNQANQPNFNFAPEQVLLALDNIDAATAKTLIAARKKRAFSSADDVGHAAGKILNINEMETVFGASRFIRLTLGNRDGGTMQEVYYTLPRESGGNTSPLERSLQIPVPKALIMGNKTRDDYQALEIFTR